MAYRPPVAVLDACILYPVHLRNILVQCAVDRLADVRWTDRIHDEWIRNLTADNTGLSSERLKQTRDLMKAAVPAADVRGVDHLVAGIVLPDPDDRHVVAAAVAGSASVIVTWNVRDFPNAELDRYGLRVETPDQFLLGLHAAVPGLVLAMLANAYRNLRISLPTMQDFENTLERQGLQAFTAAVRGRWKKTTR